MSEVISLADKLDEMIELVKQKQKEVNAILQSKDQQIKDLTELLKKGHECIMYTHEHSKSPAYIFREYRKLYDSYQQKYHKP